jgi:hypothetical protein
VRRRRTRRGVAGDQERAHVAGDEHRADEDGDDEQHRPGVAKERGRRLAAARKPLGERAGAQEEEPGGAANQPDAADFRRDLAKVGERQAEGEHGSSRRQNEDDGDAEAAVAAARADHADNRMIGGAERPQRLPPPKPPLGSKPCIADRP